MTKIIGLTGGIGSGKTTIAKHIEQLGIPVYIADLEAKKIVETEVVISKIIDAFGENILENNKIDRTKLSKLVFENPEKLKTLNAIIHPEVAIHFKNWVNKHQNSSIVVKETAILFESGSYKNCDKIILVTAPKEVRIQRVMKRDNLSRQAIESRIANQWSEEKKEKLSDFIIVNENLSQALITAENIVSLLRNQ